MRRLTVLAVMCALLLAACAGEDAAAPPVPAVDPTAGEAATEPEPGDAPGTDAAATDPAATEPSSPEPDTEAPGEDAASTPEAIDFEAPLVGGGTFDGGDYDGRDVALWFWAPW